MAHLLEALEENEAELTATTASLQEMRAQAGAMRLVLNDAGERLEAQAAPLPDRVSGAVDQLAAGGERLLTACAALESESAACGEEAEQQRAELDTLRGSLEQQHEEFRRELGVLSTGLAAERDVALQILAEATATAAQALDAVCLELTAFEGWLRAELIPVLAGETQRVQQHSAELRLLLAGQLVPALLTDGERLAQALQAARGELTTVVGAGAAAVQSRAQSALERLTATLDALCGASAEAASAACRALDAPQQALRDRGGELLKQARIYAEAAAAASRQMGTVTATHSTLEALLVLNRLLSPLMLEEEY